MATTLVDVKTSSYRLVIRGALNGEVTV